MTTPPAPVAPHDIEAEETVLGALLLAAGDGVDVATRVAEKVRRTGLGRDDFYRESHGAIYDAALALVDADTPPTASFLRDELRRRGKLDDIGEARLRELGTLASATANAPHYAQAVVDVAARRSLWSAARAAEAAALNGGIEAHPEVREQLETALRGRGTSGRRLEPLWHRDALEREPVLQQRWLVRELVRPASVGVIAGEPETYKSLLAVEVACKVAAGGSVLGRFLVEEQEPPVTVAYVWQDDSEDEELARIQAYAKAHELGGETEIAWYLNQGLTLPDGLPDLRREVEQHGFNLVCLDSLYNFLPALDLRTEDVLPILNGLKGIADETGAAILVVDHAPKPSESTRGRRANLTPYGSVFKAAAFRWGIYTEGGPDGIRLSAGSNNAPAALKRELVVFDREAYELRLVETTAVGLEEYADRILAFLEEHPGASTKAVLEGVKGKAESLREALKTLKEAGPLTSRSSRDLGLPGTGTFWYPANHADLGVVPLFGTTQDVPGSAVSQSPGVVPSSLPRRGDDPGRDYPSEEGISWR